MNPEIRESIEDALKHARQIKEFSIGHDLRSYSQDPKTRMAVERSFEVMPKQLF